MKLYRIKHLPSGLYYKPSTYGSKLNVSKKGKVYQRKPSIPTSARLARNESLKYWDRYPYTTTPASDWEIEELNMNAPK